MDRNETWRAAAGRTYAQQHQHLQRKGQSNDGGNGCRRVAERADLAVRGMIGVRRSSVRMDQQRREEDRDRDAQQQRKDASSCRVAVGERHRLQLGQKGY